MGANIAVNSDNKETWGGGGAKPFGASYGKMMMWFFIVSDALTFSGFLAAYGFSRFKFIDAWPIADEVFTHFPFLHGVDAPMYYVAFMTFILIISSVTMVLAVDAGHHMNKSKVTIYMFLTIIFGLIFVGSQAWEWGTFIKGDYGAVQTKGGNILQFGHYVDKDGEQVFKERTSILFKTMQVVRMLDKKRNVLIYLVYSDKLVDGSPKNSISTVPIRPW